MSYTARHRKERRHSWLELAAVPVIALSGLVMVPGAHASSGGCAFGNGCATLHGVNAAGNPVAMDAKYQNPHEILIGYPDNAGDGATSFDGVLHFTTGHSPAWQDTALLVQQPENDAFVHRYFLGCINGADSAAHNPLTVDKTFSFEGHSVVWSLTDALDPDVAIDPVTGEITDPGSPADVPGGISTADVTVTDGADVANAVVTVNDTSGVVITVNSGNCIEIDRVPAEQAGGIQFDAVDRSFTGDAPGSANHPETFTWKAAGLPGNLAIDPNTGFIAPGNAAPGSYGVTVTATDASGAKSIITFTLDVRASETTVINHQPFYTFVYAPNGKWTSQCVTDVNGSGALRLIPCTLGRDRYQDFFALDSAGSPVQIADGTTQYHFQDWLAQIANPGKSCLTDPSTLSPGTPQSDATDMGFNGRQLRTDGSCSVLADQWNWNT